MDRIRKSVMVLHLAEKLREKGSWCGETHMHKAMYFLQSALYVDTDFDFVFYKHGPFSFDLRDFVAGLLADDLLKLEPQIPPYGPRYNITDDAETLQERFPKFLAEHGPQVETIADYLGRRGVTELERLSSALYVTKEGATADCDDESRVSEIVELKPHVSRDEALSAVHEVDEFLAGLDGVEASSNSNPNPNASAAC